MALLDLQVLAPEAPSTKKDPKIGSRASKGCTYVPSNLSLLCGGSAYAPAAHDEVDGS